MPDPATLAVVAVAISALAAASFGVLARSHPHLPGLSPWAWSSACLSAALALVVARTRWGPDPTLVLGSFAVAAAAAIALARGAAAFVGRSPRWRGPLGLTTALFAIDAWFLVVHDIPIVRVFCTAALAALWCGLGASELLRERTPGQRFSCRVNAAAMILLAVAVAGRALLSVAAWGGDPPFDPALPQVIHFATMILWVTSWICGTALLVAERQSVALERSASARLRAEASLRDAERRLAEARDGRESRPSLACHLDGADAMGVSVGRLVALLKAREAADPDLLDRLEDAAARGPRELRRVLGTLEAESASWADWLADIRAWASETLASRGVALRWNLAGPPPRSPLADAAAALSLARAVREAITNAARHARAESVTIAVRFRGAVLAIRVCDDGAGIDDAALPGRGLRAMRRRAEACGGRCRVARRRRAAGTAAAFVLPLPLRIAERPVADIVGGPTR